MANVPLDDHDLLIGLHAKVDYLIGTVNKGLDDHEKRLRKVESSGQRYKGSIAALAFVAGMIEPLLLWLRGNK